MTYYLFKFEAPWPGFEPESRARQAHMIAPTPPGHRILNIVIQIIHYQLLYFLSYINISEKHIFFPKFYNDSKQLN